MERKWTDRQYHVQDNSDVAHQNVRIYCNTNQFPAYLIRIFKFALATEKMM